MERRHHASEKNCSLSLISPHLCENRKGGPPAGSFPPSLGALSSFQVYSASEPTQLSNQPTEFLSVTGATSGTVIPSATNAVVDLAETGAKAGTTPAIVAGTGLDILANAGCATVGRQAAGQMTPLPPGWNP